MKASALIEQKNTFGIAISAVAARVKLVKESEITQFTGGIPEERSFSAVISSPKAVEQFIWVETQSEGMAWFISGSAGGSPSGMVAKRKSGGGRQGRRVLRS